VLAERCPSVSKAKVPIYRVDHCMVTNSKR
jgi:hypothetical protein